MHRANIRPKAPSREAQQSEPLIVACKSFMFQYVLSKKTIIPDRNITDTTIVPPDLPTSSIPASLPSEAAEQYDGA
jgi:hypothetical protein